MKQNLAFCFCRDMANEIRHSRALLNSAAWVSSWPRSEEQTYLRECERKLLAAYRNRHGLKLDRYGWPEVCK